MCCPAGARCFNAPESRQICHTTWRFTQMLQTYVVPMPTWLRL